MDISCSVAAAALADTAIQNATMEYYLDESGNTGDLANHGTIAGFANQPIFSLAAIGTAAPATLAEAFDELRRSHRIGLSEIKSTRLLSRPAFVLDLVRYMRHKQLPFFVELVDKRYFLCSYITSLHLFRSLSWVPENAALHYAINVTADYLCDGDSEGILSSFVAACEDPSGHNLRGYFNSLLEFGSPTSNDDVRGYAVLRGAAASLEEYESACGNGTSDTHLDFLPSPDAGKHGKLIWALPNLASLMNIYARINLYQGGNLSDVKLIHDEQVQFDDVLLRNKNVAESLRIGVRAFTPHSDFNFRESATLSFTSSTGSWEYGIVVEGICRGGLMPFATFFSIHPEATQNEKKARTSSSLFPIVVPE
jgi:hypothetical protein